MAALTVGTKAPDFSLPIIGEGGKFSLQDALQQGPVLLAFFKVSCPTCQYTFPFLERIHRAHGDKKVAIVGTRRITRATPPLFSRSTASPSAHCSTIPTATLSPMLTA